MVRVRPGLEGKIVNMSKICLQSSGMHFVGFGISPWDIQSKSSPRPLSQTNVNLTITDYSLKYYSCVVGFMFYL